MQKTTLALVSLLAVGTLSLTACGDNEVKSPASSPSATSSGSIKPLPNATPNSSPSPLPNSSKSPEIEGAVALGNGYTFTVPAGLSKVDRGDATDLAYGNTATGDNLNVIVVPQDLGDVYSSKVKGEITDKLKTQGLGNITYGNKAKLDGDDLLRVNSSLMQGGETVAVIQGLAVHGGKSYIVSLGCVTGETCESSFEDIIASWHWTHAVT